MFRVPAHLINAIEYKDITFQHIFMRCTYVNACRSQTIRGFNCITYLCAEQRTFSRDRAVLPSKTGLCCVIRSLTCANISHLCCVFVALLTPQLFRTFYYYTWHHQWQSLHLYIYIGCISFHDIVHLSRHVMSSLQLIMFCINIKYTWINKRKEIYAIQWQQTIQHFSTLSIGNTWTQHEVSILFMFVHH